MNESEAHKPEDLVNLSEIGRILGVNRTTVQKWHAYKGGTEGSAKPESPLLSVAQAMNCPTPEAIDTDQPQYPWQVVVAFAKATGYMDADGNLVPQIQNKGKGRWSPVEMTIDPYVDPKDPKNRKLRNNRRRYYSNHAADLLKIKYSSLRQLRVRGDNAVLPFPEPDGMDELARPYWWLETLQTRMQQVHDQKDRRGSGPEPDGYLENGQPYWNAGPDNYWVRKWEEANGGAKTQSPQEGTEA